MSLGQRALWAAIAALLATQGATAYALYRFVVARPAAPAAPLPAELPRQSASFPRHGHAPSWLAPRATTDTTSPTAPGSAVTPRIPTPLKPHAHQSAWSSRPLDEAGTQLAAELGCSPDDLRLFTDTRGAVAEPARRGLLAGHDAGMKIAQDLGLEHQQAEGLGQVVVGYMVRRVGMRESFRGTAVTSEAIDDAVRKDTLALAEGSFDAQAREAVDAVLTGLPDLTADRPR